MTGTAPYSDYRKKQQRCDCLDDCKYCPHQRIQHADKDGVCLVGLSINKMCVCIGFEPK